MATEAQTVHRGSLWQRRGVSEIFHQCWYPVALGREVAVGKAISKKFLNGRVVVWRGEDGRARVHSAYCRHFGADLSVGEVVGNRIRCPFHYWEYDESGRCAHIPAQSAIPPRATLFNFPVAEKWGMVWAFNGESALYELPHFPTLKEEQIAWRVFACPPMAVPPWVFLANSQDFQHIRVVHKASMEKEPDVAGDGLTFEFHNDIVEPSLGPVHQHFKLFGTNCLAFEQRGERIVVMTLFAATPTNDGMTTGYVVTATPRIPGADLEAILDRGEAFGRRIQAEDNPILESMRFKPDLPIAADKHLMRWIERAERFPSANPAEPLIT